MERLHDLLTALQQRLDGLCVPENTAGASESRPSQVERAPSELRLFLVQQAVLVSAANDRLESVLTRLEV